MEIIIGKTAGFCFGVSNAVNKTKEALSKEKICCLGELVHNYEVTNNLKKEGLIVINKIEEAHCTTIIRSHGENIETYNKAREKGIKLIDLTCPKVLHIHNIAEEYSKKEYYIFLIGQKDHPETIATISYCGENASILENDEDIEIALKKLKESKLNNLLIISQTTYSIEKFKKIVDLIKNNIGKTIKIETKNTICDATRLRQEETKKIAQLVDMMIIIGGKHSSNTNKLYELSKQYCKNAILIETSKELNLTDIKNIKKIGIMAGASTPKESIDSVVEKINNIC
jgi:4-hydroxy-3-methylbut-2-enyl diphosphate reductase